MRPAHCLAALLGAVTACRTMSATPKHGGAPWHEVTTAHFVVWTDLPEAAALQRAADLEDFRRFFVASMFGGADVLGQPTLAIILARDDDWNLTIAAERASYSMGLPAVESPTLGPVLAAPGGDERGFHWGMVGKIHEHVVRIAVRELALDARRGSRTGSRRTSAPRGETAAPGSSTIRAPRCAATGATPPRRPPT